MRKLLIIMLTMLFTLVLFACDTPDPEQGSAETPTFAGETSSVEETTAEETTSEETTAEETTAEETTAEETTSEETTFEETTAEETTSEETTSEETTAEETTAEETTTVEETTEEEIEEMETTVLNDEPASVGVYDKYDLDTYMKPIWDGKVVHNETVMFVGMDDKATLLYTPDEIISVRSYDLSIEYEEGVDYKLEDGRLVLLPNTRIPVCPLETYYSVHNNMPYLSTMYNGQVTQTMFGEGTTMVRWQVAVTYKHTDNWEGINPASYRKTYENFIKKLENGEDVTIFFYGDSITAGASASEATGGGPDSPIWPVMFCQYVAKQYGYTVKYVNTAGDASLTEGIPSGGGKRESTVFGTNGTITYINTAVGGWSTQKGRDCFDTYVKRYINVFGCDLFVLAFGMNNGSNTANEVCSILNETVYKIANAAPESEIVMVSPMIPNPEAVRNEADTFFCSGNQPSFEPEMLVLADALKSNFNIKIKVAPMTSISKYIHSQKRFRDTTGNNVNHPSDFVVRAYAQTIYQTVFGYQYLTDNTGSGDIDQARSK